MSFNWSDFLTLADSLQRDPNTPGPEEACLRTAVSRAYYAAFRSAGDFAQVNEGFVPTRNATDHKRVQEHFRNLGDATHRKISTDLSRLRDNRRKADYDSSVHGLLPMSQSSVQIACHVLNHLMTCSVGRCTPAP